MEKSLQHPRFVSSPASLRTHPAREKWALSRGAFFINRIRKCEDRATKPALENWVWGCETETYDQLSRRLQFNKSWVSFPAPFSSSPAGELPGQLGVL